MMAGVTESPIRVGISSCILGEAVRYDGGHKLDRYIRDTLGKFVTFVPVCPEVECGMPVPREAIRLEGDAENPRLIGARSGENYSVVMQRWISTRIRLPEEQDLCGYIFKSRSPSCGIRSIRVYHAGGGVSRDGTGLWARALMTRYPLLPVEEDGRLHDPHIRENFIERLFVYRRWKALTERGKTRGRLVDFHTRHKLLIMAHSETLYRALGHLVGQAADFRPVELYDRYLAQLDQALRLQTTVRKNVNVLQHTMGYFKHYLTAAEKRELAGVIDDYRREYIPLIVPVTMLNHYTRKYEQAWLQDQYYLNPHPMELKLRNHV